MNEKELINKINNLIVDDTFDNNQINSNLQIDGMSSTQIKLIQYLIELIFKYGIPSFISLISTWKIESSDITLKNIQDLKSSIKPPEEYFGKDKNNGS